MKKQKEYSKSSNKSNTNIKVKVRWPDKRNKKGEYRLDSTVRLNQKKKGKHFKCEVTHTGFVRCQMKDCHF